MLPLPQMMIKKIALTYKPHFQIFFSCTVLCILLWQFFKTMLNSTVSSANIITFHIVDSIHTT